MDTAPLAVDTDYPPSTASQRLADDRTAQGAIDWLAVLRHRASAAAIAKVPAAFAAAVSTGEAFDKAHALCLAHVAVHDRAKESADETRSALLDEMEALSDELVAELGAGPAAPFAVVAGITFRDMRGLTEAPDLELIFRSGEVLDVLGKKKDCPRVQAAVARCRPLVEPYRVAFLEEVVSRELAEQALAARTSAAQAFNAACIELEKDATQAGVWEEMSPQLPPFRHLALIPAAWNRVANFRWFRRRVKSAFARHAMLAAAVLAVAFPCARVGWHLGEEAWAWGKARLGFGSAPISAVQAPLATVVPATPTPGRVDMIMGTVYNRDARDWTVDWQCPKSGAQGSFVLPALSPDPTKQDASQHNPRIGYGHNGEFNCPVTLEGGTSSCVFRGGDSCVIQNGNLAPAAP